MINRPFGYYNIFTNEKARAENYPQTIVPWLPSFNTSWQKKMLEFALLKMPKVLGRLILIASGFWNASNCGRGSCLEYALPGASSAGRLEPTVKASRYCDINTEEFCLKPEDKLFGSCTLAFIFKLYFLKKVESRNVLTS